MSDKSSKRPDPLYDGIAKLRRQNRRIAFVGLLVIAAILVLVIAIVRHFG
jgi:hypothetical protein